MKINNSEIKTPIEPNMVKTIEEKNKTLSTLLSIGLSIVIVVGLLGLGTAISMDAFK